MQEKIRLDELDFLDVEEGMSFCSESEEFYKEVLETYLEEERYLLLQKLYENEEWEEYEIQIHGLKGSSFAIGATVIADLAKILEVAVKERDFFRINREHHIFMEEYQKLLTCLEKFLS